MTAKILMNVPLTQIYVKVEDVQIRRAHTGANVMKALNPAEMGNSVLTAVKASALDSSLVVCAPQ